MASLLRCSVVCLAATGMITASGLGGCDDKSPANSDPPSVYAIEPDDEQGPARGGGLAPGGTDVQSDGVLRFAGMTAIAPEGWIAETTSGGMRAVQMTVPGVDGAGDASFVIYTGISGSVDQNIARWEGQFSYANGRSIPATRTTQESGELHITTAEITGAYGGGVRGEFAGSGITMIQSIVEKPDGEKVFVRLLGPSDTVEAHKKAFQEVLGSIK